MLRYLLGAGAREGIMLVDSGTRLVRALGPRLLPVVTSQVRVDGTDGRAATQTQAGLVGC